jgi:hypothetical protein
MHARGERNGMALHAGIPAFLSETVPIRLGQKKWLFLGFFAARPAGDRLSRPFDLETQSQTEWCWAAVASAVHRYLDGQYLQQCQVVDRQWPGFGCCAQPSGDDCNQPESLADVLGRLGNRNGDIWFETLQFETLGEQLRADRPVCCGLVKDQLGHFVVVTGCFYVQGTPFVTLKDPTFGNSEKTVSYADLRSGYRETQWVETYLTKTSRA